MPPPRRICIAILLLPLSMSAQGLLDLQEQWTEHLVDAGQQDRRTHSRARFPGGVALHGPGATFEMNRTHRLRRQHPARVGRAAGGGHRRVPWTLMCISRGVVQRPASDRTIADLGGMVHAAAEEFGAGDRFHSFSPPTGRAVDRLTRIDWSQAR